MTRQYPHFEVTYWGEDDTPKEIIQVRAVPLRSKAGGLSDVIKLQEKLLRDFVETNGKVGDLLIRDSVWNNMKKLSSMLPVIGKAEPGFDIEPLADASDLGQLARIFFSESIGDDLQRIMEDGEVNVINHPSSIARIHDINFSGSLVRIMRERQEEEHQEKMKKLEEKLENLKDMPQPAAEMLK